MPLWSQHLLIALAVLACVGYIGWQAVRSLRGHKSKLSGCGSCKACGTHEPSSTPAPRPATPPGRVAIIPLEMLARGRKGR